MAALMGRRVMELDLKMPTVGDVALLETPSCWLHLLRPRAVSGHVSADVRPGEATEEANVSAGLAMLANAELALESEYEAVDPLLLTHFTDVSSGAALALELWRRG